MRAHRAISLWRGRASSPRPWVVALGRAVAVRVALAARLAVAVGLAAALVPAGLRGQTGGPTEGEYLYRVEMLRAAPGAFNELMEVLRESYAVHAEAGDPVPFWMRHSQGDQWDFMLLHPIGDLVAYYGADRAARRAEVWGSARGRVLLERREAATAYHEDWLARSAPLAEVSRRFEGMDFYHIEMFAGLPGKREALFEQRRMENRYYAHLNRQQNLLFVRAGGPNWDAMTIGFYESLQAYAAAGVRYTREEQDEAARAAGFEGVDHISPYLRSLLAYHHDTLATRAR